MCRRRHGLSSHPNSRGVGSILFMVGEEDLIQGEDTTLSYVDFARNLEALTAEPKDLRVFQNSADHGFELLNNVPEALDLLLLWLETNL